MLSIVLIYAIKIGDVVSAVQQNSVIMKTLYS